MYFDDDGVCVFQVNGLIENYLRSERTIILAIVPANQDVATVDILERAKKVQLNMTILLLILAECRFESTSITAGFLFGRFVCPSSGLFVAENNYVASSVSR